MMGVGVQSSDIIRGSHQVEGTPFVIPEHPNEHVRNDQRKWNGKRFRKHCESGKNFSKQREVAETWRHRGWTVNMSVNCMKSGKDRETLEQTSLGATSIVPFNHCTPFTDGELVKGLDDPKRHATTLGNKPFTTRNAIFKKQVKETNL